MAGSNQSGTIMVTRKNLVNLPHNKSLLRSGGRWYLVCKALALFDKVPMTSLGEPPAAELSRWATLCNGSASLKGPSRSCFGYGGCDDVITNERS
jgi:hypothetical protein